MNEAPAFSPFLNREGLGRVAGTAGISTPTLPPPFQGEGSAS